MKNTGPEWRFSPSLLEYVCLIAGALSVFWYSWIMDDAYVYFRYVDNWVIHGQGLVWNPGEFVEGYSSPLWALLLGLCRLLHLDYWIIVRAVALLCFLVFWYLACIINRGFMPAPQRGQGVSYNVPLIYLSFTYAVACYFSSGLESPLVNVSAAIFAAGVLWPQSWLLQGLIGVTPLVRHEFALPFVLFLAWSLFFKRVRPISALVVFTLTVGAYGLFRLWYFADLLPNTFYLKDTTSVVQGIKFLYDALLPYFTIPYVAAMCLMFWILSRHSDASPRRNERLAMAALGISVAAYVVKIGGDPRHFRYLAFSYLLMVLATGGLLEHMTSGLSPVRRRYVTGFLLLFGFTVGLCYPRQLQQHPVFRSCFAYKHTGFMWINDAAVHRFHATGVTPPWNALTSVLGYAQARMRFQDGVPHTLQNVGRPLWRTAATQGSTVPLIADSWCQNAYLHPASPVIHSLGLTDAFLARTRMRANSTAHKLGLLPLAEDLLGVRCKYGFGRGVFDRAVEEGMAPGWVSDNIESLRAIEAKVYNRHDLVRNTIISFSPVVKIRIAGHDMQHNASGKDVDLHNHME